MSWVLLSVLFAAFLSGQEICAKFSLSRPESQVTITAMLTASVSVFLLLPIVIYTGNWRSLYDASFLWGIAGNVALNTLADLVWLRCIRRFDVSYVSALTASSPLFFGVFSSVFLGQTPKALSILFMVLILVGAILIESKRGVVQTLTQFFKDSGWVPLLFFICLAAGATVFSKIAVTHGDPQAYIAFRYLCMTILFYMVHGWRHPEHKIISFHKGVREALKAVDLYALGAGLFLTLAVVCEMNALQHADMAYVEAISKFSLFFTFLGEAVLIKKGWDRGRLVAGLIILAGGVGIALVDYL